MLSRASFLNFLMNCFSNVSYWLFTHEGRVYGYAHAQTCPCTYMAVHIHAGEHTCPCTYMPMHICDCAHTCLCTHMAVHITPMHIFALAHTCLWTYMAIHIMSYAPAHTWPCTYGTHLCPFFLSIGAFSRPCCDSCTLKPHTQGMLSAFIPPKKITCYLSFPKTV